MAKNQTQNAGMPARGDMKGVKTVADMKGRPAEMGGRGSMPKEVGHKAGSDMGAVPGAANAGGRGADRVGDMGYYSEARCGEIDQKEVPRAGNYDTER